MTVRRSLLFFALVVGVATTGGNAYAGEVAIGSVRHFFGYQIAASRGGTVSVCPFAGFGAFKATSTNVGDTVAVKVSRTNC
jgi:hypothetical protein